MIVCIKGIFYSLLWTFKTFYNVLSFHGVKMYFANSNPIKQIIFLLSHAACKFMLPSQQMGVKKQFNNPFLQVNKIRSSNCTVHIRHQLQGTCLERAGRVGGGDAKQNRLRSLSRKPARAENGFGTKPCQDIPKLNRTAVGQVRQ